MPKYLQMVCQSGKWLIINSGLSERVSDIGQLSGQVGQVGHFGQVRIGEDC